MPRDGSNVWSAPAGTTATPGTTIESAKYNALVSDLTTLANEARPISAGGTGASTAGAALTNLGAQPADAELTAIAGLTSAADRLPYFTGSGTAALATFTAAGRALVDDADAAAQRTTLGATAAGSALFTAATAAAQRTALGATTVGDAVFTAASAASARTAIGAAASAPDAILEDQKASGTAGQTLSAGSWQTRDLNTEVYDPNSIVSIATNQFTPTVDCYCEWLSPFASTNQGATRLFNVTDAVSVAVGTAMRSPAAGNTHSFGQAFLTAGKTYRLECQVAAGGAGTGGTASGFATEIYSRVKLWRL